MRTPVQVLTVEERVIGIATHQDEPEVGVFSMGVQTYEEWRAAMDADLAVVSLEVFAIADPGKMDVGDVMGELHRDKRQDITVWKSGRSDVEGCEHWHSPVQLQPKMNLNSPFVPALSLLDLLAARGFVGKRGVVLHDGGTLFYDARTPWSRRAYFRCVIAFEDIKAQGVDSFSSKNTENFSSYS